MVVHTQVTITKTAVMGGQYYKVSKDPAEANSLAAENMAVSQSLGLTLMAAKIQSVGRVRMVSGMTRMATGIVGIWRRAGLRNVEITTAMMAFLEMSLIGNTS